MLKVFLCWLAPLLVVSAASAQTVPAPSTWVNQRTSVLTILFVDSTGDFRGTYVNNADGTQCKGFPYPASGHTDGAKVSFAVTFAPCNTVTVWEGKIKGATFNTTFEAAYPNNGRIEIWRGPDIFIRH